VRGPFPSSQRGWLSGDRGDVGGHEDIPVEHRDVARLIVLRARDLARRTWRRERACRELMYSSRDGGEPGGRWISEAACRRSPPRDGTMERSPGERRILAAGALSGPRPPRGHRRAPPAPWSGDAPDREFTFVNNSETSLQHRASTIGPRWTSRCPRREDEEPQRVPKLTPGAVRRCGERDRIDLTCTIYRGRDSHNVECAYE
jgi:hypothetical protein